MPPPSFVQGSGTASALPSTRRETVRQLAPFAVTTALAFVAVALPPATDGEAKLLALAGALALLLVAVPLAVPPQRLPRGAQVVGPLLFLVLVALLRDAEGGAVSGYSILVLLPVVWLALYGDRLELLMMLVGSALVLALQLSRWASRLIP